MAGFTNALRQPLTTKLPARHCSPRADLIPSRHWRAFSALLDLTPASGQPSFEKKRTANPMLEKVEKVPTREAREEGLRAL